MSAATSTIAANPPAPTSASAPPAAADPASQTSAPAAPVQSFTEVLSAQRAAPPHDGRDHHDAEATRDPSHGEEAGSAQEGPPSPTSVPLQSSPATPTGAASPLEPAVSVVPAAEDPSGSSTSAPEGGSTSAAEGGAAVREPEIAAGTAHSTHPPRAAPATASTDTGAPGAEVSSAATQPAAVADPEDPTADGPDSTVVSSSSPAEVSPLLGSAASRSAAAPAPAHGAAAAGPGAAAAHMASMPVEVAGPPSSPPTPPPAPHLVAESPLAPSGSPRPAGAVLSASGSAAPSAPTMAQQAASSLDVDDLCASISRPLSDGNGTYTVTVALHPPELGHLQAVLSLDGNDLSVSLAAQTQTGHDAVANAAEALKNQLARGGVNVNVTLRDPGSQAGGDERYRPPTSTGTAGPLMAESAASETPLSSGLVSGQIHLVL